MTNRNRVENRTGAIRIGGASGFWGDASLATAQLLQGGGLDFLVYDYLAEITMAILARARARDPSLGYASDFITGAMAPNLATIARQKVRVISNAGGVNPEACADAIRGLIRAQGLDLTVATVEGDDILGRVAEISAYSPAEMFTGAPFPDASRIASLNAYLGAFPIAAALDAGADIVITGRCVDSAVTLGAAIHAFGWLPDAWDMLAAGALAGHILECGTQATGGNFTDWHEIARGFDEIGYPIAAISPDGTFHVEKPRDTGGLVSQATVGEQLVYEIADPSAYILPDVVCDFSQVTLTQTGNDKVKVSGARGRPAPDSYKACLTWHDGFRGGHLFGYYGLEAEAKAEAFAEAALRRARSTLAQKGLPDFTHASVEILGAESQFGAQRTQAPAREVNAKIAVRHAHAEGVGIFLKAATGLGLSAPPGLSGFAGTRPKPSPVLRLFSFVIPKADIDITVRLEGAPVAFSPHVQSPASGPPDATNPAATPDKPAPAPDEETTDVPLIRLAWARSGDKGDMANIGILARQPNFLPHIWHALDDAHLKAVFGHFLKGGIHRYALPGCHGMNIVLTGVLDGGGTSSLRNDPQGKGFAQLLLASQVRVPKSLLEPTP